MPGKRFFNRNAPSCAYCRRGMPVATGDVILCRYRGVCRPEESCRKFRYDPLRRQPKPVPPLPRYDEADFKI